MPGPGLHQGLPGQHQYSEVHRGDQRQGFARRLRRHHRQQPSGVGVRPRLPAGDAMRRRLHGRRDPRAGGDRPPRTLRRRHRHPGEMVERPLHRADRLQDRHRRLGTCRHGLRRRHGQGWLRRHRVRGLPPGRRRSQIRHPRLPAAQFDRRRGDRESAQARRQVRVQHAGRPPVHHRADARRARLRCRVHRHRRRLSLELGHSRRLAQRRACPPTNCSPAAT